jgi:hypothetical protein
MEITRVFEEVEWKKWIIRDVLYNRYRDPWRTWQGFDTVHDLELYNQKFSDHVIMVLKKASCLLVALGLSEIWCNKQEPNIILNSLPLEVFQGTSGDWQSKFASVDEVEAAIKGLVDQIRKHLNKDIPIFFTLSPVPLKYTFSGMPVCLANKISKSTIRLALGRTIDCREKTYYFPAFEIVQSLFESGEKIWQADNRHPSALTINLVSSVFMEYLGALEYRKIDFSEFYVPYVNAAGKVSGKLLTNGSIIPD